MSEPDAPDLEVAPPPIFAPSERERKAYVCSHKEHDSPLRIFLRPDESGTPKCPQHGTPMTRQPNRPYSAR